MTKHWQGGMIKLFGRTYLLDDETGKPSREEFTLSIPKSKRNSRSNIEHPEAAYRRGYQQGAHAVLEGLEKAGVVEQWMLDEVKRFVTEAGMWRHGPNRLRREVVRDQAPQFKIRHNG